MRRVLNAGASGYIPKSATAQTVVSALQLVLSGNIYVPPLLVSAAARAADQRGARRAALAGAAHRSPGGRAASYLRDGLSNKEISANLGIAEKTVKVHIAAIFKTLNVVNRTQAAKFLHECAGCCRCATRWVMAARSRLFDTGLCSSNKPALLRFLEPVRRRVAGDQHARNVIVVVFGAQPFDDVDAILMRAQPVVADDERRAGPGSSASSGQHFVAGARDDGLEAPAFEQALHRHLDGGFVVDHEDQPRREQIARRSSAAGSVGADRGIRLRQLEREHRTAIGPRTQLERMA